MNEQELAELQKACDSATPGPWTAHDYRSDPSQEDWFGVIKGAFDIDGKAHSIGQFKFSSLPSGENWANANFIALARNALPTLLAMVRELKERETKLREMLHCATVAADAIFRVIPFVNVCDDPECEHKECIAYTNARKAMLAIDTINSQ